MNKKTECEIIQDLLLGYVDDVLNEESKKFVEKHLLECKECQSKLNEIQKDIENNENNQKKQIDYLKKIRKRNTIKTILISVGIVFFIFFIFYLRKFIIINDFMNKAEKTIKSNNFYRETAQVVTNDAVAISKEWYKDGKYKLETEIYSDDGVEKWPTEYGTVDSDERITIDHQNKKVVIESGESVKLLNETKKLKFGTFIQDYGFKTRLQWTFKFSIRTSTYDIGREYYVLNDKYAKDFNYEVWIDKDIGLPLREKGNEITKTVFKGTNIVKDEIDVKHEYKYEFDIVTDEDVAVPDLTGYKVEYVSRDSEGNYI